MNFKDFFKDKNGKIVIIQKPNLLIFVSFFFFAMQLLFTGILELIGLWGFRVVILIWSFDELFRGDSRFRQVLGFLIGIIIVFGILRDIL